LNQDVTILAGNLSAPVPLTVAGDPDFEPDETIIVTLTTVTPGISLGATPQSTVTITNDDAAPTTTTSTTTTTTTTTTTIAPTTTVAGATTTVAGATTTTAAGATTTVAGATTTTVAAGTGTISSTANNVQPGQVVTFNASGLCASAPTTFGISGPGGTAVLGQTTSTGSGQASVTAPSPSQPGVYTITAASASGACSITATSTLVVVMATIPGDLPATGSDPSYVMQIAGLTLLLGAVLLGIAVVRRKPRNAS
jgi:LPXTG-motif cell wall-anchored protein